MSPIEALKKQGEDNLGSPGYIGLDPKLYPLEINAADFYDLTIALTRGNNPPIQSPDYTKGQGDHALADTIFVQMTKDLQSHVQVDADYHFDPVNNPVNDPVNDLFKNFFDNQSNGPFNDDLVDATGQLNEEEVH